MSSTQKKLPHTAVAQLQRGDRLRGAHKGAGAKAGAKSDGRAREGGAVYTGQQE